MIINLILSLVITLIIELSTSLIMGIKEKEDIEVIALANIITNPIVVFISNIIYTFNNNIVYYLVVAFLEISALITEFIIFQYRLKFKQKSPLIVSITNNIISFSIGTVINYFI